jgi:UPF0755 protein
VRRRLLRSLILLLVGTGIALPLAWRNEIERSLLPPGAAPELLNVPPGATADSVARDLWAMGHVRHPLVFRALVHARGAAARLRAGRYPIEPGLSLEDLLDRLQRGIAERHDVTIPEGRSILDIVELAAAQGVPRAAFLAAVRDPSPVRDLDPKAADLEGYLFPDTYDVPQGEEAATALAARMVQRFRSVVTSELPRIARSGLTLREVVTLASIVELETAREEERSRIAAVFLNRLEKGMRLQTDPTVIYALRKAGRWDGNIRKQDLELDSPYNTYRYAGLPPGPIGSPGRAAILAVLEPAPVDDLYFVSRNDGTHEFSETLTDHERAVDRFQRYRRSMRMPAAAPGGR